MWQAEVGTAAQPWLADHRIRNVAVLPGAAYCEMALAAARTVLGEAAEVRDIRFEQALLLDEQTTVGASASLSSPGVVDFVVESDQGGEQTRQATAVLHAADDEQPTCLRHVRATCRASGPQDGAEVRKGLDQRGVQYGPAFTGLGAVHTGEDATGTVLAEVALPSQIRTQQGCLRRAPGTAGRLFPVRCGQSADPEPSAKACWGCHWVSGGCAPTALPATPTTATPGSPRSTLPGSRPTSTCSTSTGQFCSPCRDCDCGTGASGSDHNGSGAGRAAADHRMAAARIAGADIRRRRNLAADQHHRHRGSGRHDVDRHPEKPRCTMHHMCWPPNADHASNAGQLASSCVPEDSPVW